MCLTGLKVFQSFEMDCLHLSLNVNTQKLLKGLSKMFCFLESFSYEHSSLLLQVQPSSFLSEISS